jgi:hypothetical protein
MLLELLPYLLVLMLGTLAAVLLTSRALSEKLVSAGLLPRAFLSLVPMIQTAARVFGFTLVVAGVLGIGIESGWINREYLARYGFASSLLLVGVVIVLLSTKLRQ